MAKQLTSAQKAARRTHKVAQTAKNKAAKRARHAKAHPNDAQVAKGKFTERKAPRVKGNFRKVNKAYRDEAGHVLPAPSFAPIAKAK
ncbi:hypothetical protein FDJ19_gp090 [Vibrio phage Ceto]|uniref:Uncharacterized protein n=1 Tax=Vibrio phage Ceto TaxID=2570300 RepID=A0A2H5BGI1_9CAUD|nr:hypothetical protein FDJ19_gp090 [Vibrio phage Ceto]AUG85097.1 hypothetical protein CETO_90 [Vibrio phage Ceto]